MATDALGNALRFILTGGERHDITQAEELIENFSAGYVIADKGYDYEAFVLKLKEQNSEAVIPSRSNHKAQRGIDSHLYKERHLIENQIKKEICMSAYVFVGHWFIQKYIDDYREAVETAFLSLDKSPKVEYADSHVITGQILQLGIQPMIDNALFCIFDISNESRPNIALELGYAYGRDKYVVMTSDTLPKELSDISGYAIVIYNSFKELRGKLTKHLPEYLSKAIEHNEKVTAKPISTGQFLLDNRKTKQLLELHRASLADRLLPFAINYLRNMKLDSEYYNYDFLFRSVRGGIEESRRLLKGFRNKKVGDIKNFVERNFTDFKLARIIKNEIVPILLSKELDDAKKWEELDAKIREEEERVFKEFYQKLEDDSDDEEE